MVSLIDTLIRAEAIKHRYERRALQGRVWYSFKPHINHLQIDTSRPYFLPLALFQDFARLHALGSPGVTCPPAAHPYRGHPPQPTCPQAAHPYRGHPPGPRARRLPSQVAPVLLAASSSCKSTPLSGRRARASLRPPLPSYNLLADTSVFMDSIRLYAFNGLIVRIPSPSAQEFITVLNWIISVEWLSG